MQKIIDGKTTVIIDGEDVTINGVEYAPKLKKVADVHPFLKDVPEAGETAYVLFANKVSDIPWGIHQDEIDRGTASLNRQVLVELDNRRLAETALRKWIGENGIPVATEEQMADKDVWKYSFAYSYFYELPYMCEWTTLRPVGDIHFLSKADFEKVRDHCDALIRKAYGWPEVG